MKRPAPLAPAWPASCCHVHAHTIAASPTKIPQYLAAGLPVVGNQGIGYIDELLTAEALALAAEPDIAVRCRNVLTLTLISRAPVVGDI